MTARYSGYIVGYTIAVHGPHCYRNTQKNSLFDLLNDYRQSPSRTQWIALFHEAVRFYESPLIQK